MSKLTIFIAWLAVLAGSPHPALSQTATAPIERHQIAAALSSSTAVVSPEQVVLLSPVTARRLAPALEVVSVEIMDGARTKAKLRCPASGECLPFYAIVTWPSVADAERAARRWPGLRPSIPSALPTVHEAWLVRAGEPAVLVLEGTHVLIKLPVICLSNGSAGKSVRVSTTDHRRVYRAEVVAAGVLKGGF